MKKRTQSSVQKDKDMPDDSRAGIEPEQRGRSE